MLFLLTPPLFFFAFSLTSKLNIGVRHILPVYAFFIVTAAVGAVWTSRKFRFFRYILLLILLFHAGVALRVAPDYIAFANDFAGGTNKTYRIFPDDSSVEWGQNDKLVNEYLARENIKDCWFAGWGNVELMSVSQPCRMLPNSFPRVIVPLDEPIPPVIEGTVLISVASLPPRGGSEYLPVAQSEPIAQIGGSIFVYQGRFEVPLVAALSHATRANQLVRPNRFEEAVADARAAVELAPDDPRPHLSLGIALSRNGKTDEARKEFETVIELAKSNASLFRNAENRARRELGRVNKE
jgi:tetratricopeptide (TPR) repeat protein